MFGLLSSCRHARLRRELAAWLASTAPPAALPRCSPGIDADHITRWDRFGAGGTVRGMAYVDGVMAEQTITLAPLGQLDASHTDPHWCGDVRQLSGLSGFNSRTPRYFSLRDVLDTPFYQQWVSEVSAAQLTRLLGHGELSVFTPGRQRDALVLPLWDGRLFLRASGGRHTTAAIHCLASALHQAVPIYGPRTVLALRPAAVAALLAVMLPVQVPAWDALRPLLRRHRIPCYWLPLPPPYQQEWALLLPRAEPRSMAAATALLDGGCPDLGAQLRAVIAAQHDNQLHDLSLSGE